MKLATLRDGSRDGQLIVVARDLNTAHIADGIAPTLQRALDDWNFIAPQLDALYADLNQGKAKRPFEFDAAACMAPLPRAYQWLDASAYNGHLQRMKEATGVDWVALSSREPLVYQGGSDDFLGAREDAPFPDEAHGIDFEAEIAVVTGDVPMGTKHEDALEHVRLVMLVNDWSLRNLGPNDLKKQFGFFLSKPSTAFSPVAVTPDELQDAWRDGRAAVTVRIDWNGVRFGELDAAEDTRFGFGELITFAARTRTLSAGTVIGLGTISSTDAARGFATIAEARAQEKISSGEARTPFMKYGDRVRIDAQDAAGHSIFGAIEQAVASSRRRRVMHLVNSADAADGNSVPDSGAADSAAVASGDDETARADFATGGDATSGGDATTSGDAAASESGAVSDASSAGNASGAATSTAANVAAANLAAAA